MTTQAADLPNEVQLTTEERVARIEKILGIDAEGKVNGSPELLALVAQKIGDLLNNPRGAQQLTLGILQQAIAGVTNLIDDTEADLKLVLLHQFIPGAYKVTMDAETQLVTFYEKEKKDDFDPETGWVRWTELDDDPVQYAEVTRLVINLGLDPHAPKYMTTQGNHNAIASKVAQIMQHRSLARTVADQAVAKTKGKA